MKLALGPTLIESSAGFTTALPRDLVILQATIHANLATVALAKPLCELSPAEEVLAVGQLLHRARRRGGGGLEVTVGGVPEPLRLPGGGTKVERHRADYASLLNP